MKHIKSQRIVYKKGVMVQPTTLSIGQQYICFAIKKTKNPFVFHCLTKLNLWSYC